MDLAYYKADLCELAEPNSDELRRALALFDTQFISTTERANMIENTCGVPCNRGQKSSRVVNSICKKLGVTENPAYNSKFAKFADTLNPLQVTCPAILSVHPCDYLEMSGASNSWHSCHNLGTGCYKAGPFSYMQDTCSMIFYTVSSKEDCEVLYNLPKVNREVFCYRNNALLQSRLYPDYTLTYLKDSYRDLVQRIMATCLDVPNLWALKRDINTVTQYAYTDADSMHYPDYEYNEYQPTISLLPDAPTGALLIGSAVPCLICGEWIEEPEYLMCDDCRGMEHCASCGNLIHPDDTFWVDGRPYCDECVFYCNHCDTYGLEELIPAYNSDGEIEYVCESCVCYCDDCGTAYVEGAEHVCAEVSVCV